MTINPLQKVIYLFTLKYIVEIKEYAQYLGMDPDQEKELLWIAEEGVSLI